MCHNSEMPAKRGRKAGLQTGRAYEFEIIKMDEFDKRIGLRCLGYDPLQEDEPEPAQPQAAAPDLPPVAPVAEAPAPVEETAAPVEEVAAPVEEPAAPEPTEMASACVKGDKIDPRKMI